MHQEHINLHKTEHELSKLCLGYLTLPHLDEAHLDADIKALALKGSYSFLNYAGMHWVDHLEEWVRRTDVADPSIVGLLRRFLQEYWPLSINKSTASSGRTSLGLFANFDIYASLTCAVRTWKEQCESYGTTVVSTEILKLVDRISRVRAIIENMLTEATGNDRLKQQLHTFYGTNLYKCSRLSCKFFEEGFPTAAQRDYHIGKHLKAFTCTHCSCLYAIIGFKTRRELERHASVEHRELDGVCRYPVMQDSKSINIKQAIRQGCDIEELEKWLEQFSSATAYTSQIQEAAICAIKHGNQPYVELLLNGRFLEPRNVSKLIIIALKAKQDDIASYIYGISAASLFIQYNKSAKNDMDVTPIFIAFDEERENFIKHIVLYPGVIADLISHSAEGFAILRYAIEKNRLTVIRLLLKFWPTELWRTKNESGEVPAHFAVNAGNTAVLRILLDSKECDINAQRPSGETPLHLAALKGNATFVRMLLSAGCVPDTSHEGSISDPAQSGCEEVVNILGTYWPTSHGKWLGVAQFYNASVEGNVEVVQRLLDQTHPRIPVDLPHPISGRTPLIAAIDRGHLSVVAQLVARQDVNINKAAVDDEWQPRCCTPLVVAVIKGYDLIVELLLTRLDIELHQTYLWDTGGVRSHLTAFDIAHTLNHAKISRLILDRLEAKRYEATPLAEIKLPVERIAISKNDGSNIYADIFPWTKDHPQNILTEKTAKQGYFDRFEVHQSEYKTARSVLWPKLKDGSAQQKLYSLFGEALELRKSKPQSSNHEQTTATSAEPPQ